MYGSQGGSAIPLSAPAGTETLASACSAHILSTARPGLRTILSKERRMVPDALRARASAKKHGSEISLLLHLASEPEMPGCPKLKVAGGDSQTGAPACRAG